MCRRSCLAGVLILVGLLLLAAAGALWWLGASVQRPAAATVPPLREADAAPTIRLGPTAAAVATMLPRPTPLPTGGVSCPRPSAPVRVVIPGIGVDAQVVEVGWRLVELDGQTVGEWETVAGAAGHHRGSADPGEVGNCVLSAHSSEEGGAVFRGLENVEISNAIAIYKCGGMMYTYIVSDVVKLDELGATEAQRRENARWLEPTDEPVLTLVTCWPPWSYTHRLVVRAALRRD